MNLARSLRSPSATPLCPSFGTNLYLQEIAAAGAAAEAEATEILHQKQAEAAKEAEKAAARVLSRKTRAGRSTQPTKKVVAAAVAGAGTAAMAGAGTAAMAGAGTAAAAT